MREGLWRGRPYHEGGPTDWARSFDLADWGIFLAREGGQPVAGAALAAGPAGAPVYPMDRFRREDLAVLWDIRVHPEHRRRRIGTRLFRYAVDWAWSKGLGQLGAET
ncbi:MAG: GNAT family N-acetyltransferase [Anaerolineae bacterium]